MVLVRAAFHSDGGGRWAAIRAWWARQGLSPAGAPRRALQKRLMRKINCAAPRTKAAKVTPLLHGQERGERGGAAGDLCIVPGTAGQAFQMHGEEGEVGGDEREPEVPAAEALAHEAAGHEGETSSRHRRRWRRPPAMAMMRWKCATTNNVFVKVLIEGWQGENRAGNARRR